MVSPPEPHALLPHSRYGPAPRRCDRAERAGRPRPKARFRSRSSSCTSPQWFASLLGRLESYSEFNAGFLPSPRLPRSTELRAARPAEGSLQRRGKAPLPMHDSRAPESCETAAWLRHQLGQEPGDGFVQGQHRPSCTRPRNPSTLGAPYEHPAGPRLPLCPDTRRHFWRMYTPRAAPPATQPQARPGPRRKTSRVNCDRPKHAALLKPSPPQALHCPGEISAAAVDILHQVPAAPRGHAG